MQTEEGHDFDIRDFEELMEEEQYQEYLKEKFGVEEDSEDVEE